MTYHTTINSPTGPLLLTSDGEALTGLYFVRNGTSYLESNSDSIENSQLAIFKIAQSQLNKYFSSELENFDLPILMRGSPFQLLVWAELQKIGFANTTSYGELAKNVGNLNASRAVGLANGKNPISIIVPCHRVIGANGSLTGYGGGIENKRYLLDLEKVASMRILAK